MFAFISGMATAILVGLYLFVGTINGSPAAVFSAIFGGAIIVGLAIKGFNTNPYSKPMKELQKQYKEKLEDDIAFMAALYYKVHPSYRPYVEHDIRQVSEMMQNFGYWPNDERIDYLYAQYYVSDLNYSARVAEGVYANLEL